MNISPPFTLKDLASIINAKYDGPDTHLVSGINEIHRVRKGDLTFVDVEKYYQKAFDSSATTILINKKVEAPEGKALIFHPEPFTAFNTLNRYFSPRENYSIASEPLIPKSAKIGQNVSMGEGVILGENVEIGHGSTIGNEVVIGDNTIIHPNVSIYGKTIIGKNCVIQSGTVIGGDAFYYKGRAVGRERMESVGIVKIEDYVEIGTNCSIDRGVTDVTHIGEHSKLDNLIQIGHDTIIGKNCLIASQVGIAGCVTLEENVTLWGQVGIKSDVTIGKDAILMAKTGVISDLAGGVVYGGMVADNVRMFMKKEAVLRKLTKGFSKISKALNL